MAFITASATSCHGRGRRESYQYSSARWRHICNTRQTKNETTIITAFLTLNASSAKNSLDSFEKSALASYSSLRCSEDYNVYLANRGISASLGKPRNLHKWHSTWARMENRRKNRDGKERQEEGTTSKSKNGPSVQSSCFNFLFHPSLTYYV